MLDKGVRVASNNWFVIIRASIAGLSKPTLQIKPGKINPTHEPEPDPNFRV